MKLYVGNLPWGVNDVQLRELFAQHGEVAYANVMQDRETGRSRGFGFIEMPDDDAQTAMEALNGYSIEGRPIVVNEARPRT
ncbi:MAG: RNA-binding protein [Planctomycetota bacterium]